MEANWKSESDRPKKNSQYIIVINNHNTVINYPTSTEPVKQGVFEVGVWKVKTPSN